MRAGSRALHCCLLALLLAGCAGEPAWRPESAVDTQAAASPEDSAAGSHAAPPAASPAYPTHLELTGCTGWEGYSNPFPRATAQWPAPPGWEPDDPTAVEATVLMAGYECQRLSVGPFERGPVRILYDGHDNVDVPAACRPSRLGVTSDLAVLNSMWVDDDEVALYLREALGLPARFANITEEVQDGGAARLRTWTWGDGGGRSTLTHADDGTADADLRPTSLFWTRGDGIAALEISYQRQGSAVAGRPAQGTMQPPMLLASAPQGTALATTLWYPPFPASGAFTWFADTLCTQPEA